MQRRRLPLLLAALALAVSTATACSDLDGTDGKTWITSEGSIQQVSAADRGQPVEADGEDLDGQPLDLADYRGRVVVLSLIHI